MITLQPAGRPIGNLRGRRMVGGVRAIGQRVVHLFVVLVLVSMASFLLLSLLPGDPAYALLGDTATPDQVALVHHDLHLDRSLPVRYAIWVGDLLHGNFGHSYRTGQSTADAIFSRAPTTLELLVVAALLAVLISVPAAVLAASHRGGWFDRIASRIADLLIATPPFVLAVGMIFLFAVKLRVLPATGWEPLSDSIGGNVKSITMPALAVALGGPTPALYRVLRSDLIDTLGENYVTMAEAKGLSRGYVLVRHALRPSLVSWVSLSGVELARMLGGAVIVETLFALPGIGRLITSSLYERDLIVLQGAVLFVAVVCVAINVGVDLAYAAVDPRTRRGRV